MPPCVCYDVLDSLPSRVCLMNSGFFFFFVPASIAWNGEEGTETIWKPGLGTLPVMESTRLLRRSLHSLRK